MEKPSKIRNMLLTGALVTSAALGAGGLATAVSGNGSATTTAATTTTATTPSASSSTQQAPPAMDPATLKNGPGETLANADVTAKATAAVQAKYSGATIIRVETDSGGHAYEAHIKKSDGTYATVYFDSSLNITDTESGFGGPGPQGAPGQNGSAQSGSSTVPTP